MSSPLLFAWSLFFLRTRAQLDCNGVQYSPTGQNSFVLPAGVCQVTIPESLNYMQSIMYICQDAGSGQQTVYENTYDNTNCSGTPKFSILATKALRLSNAGNSWYTLVCDQGQCNYGIARKWRTYPDCTGSIDPTTSLYEDTLYVIGDDACFKQSTSSYRYTACTENVSILSSVFYDSASCVGSEENEEIIQNECENHGTYGTILDIVECGIFTTTLQPSLSPSAPIGDEQEAGGDNTTVIIAVIVVFLLLVIGGYVFYKCWWIKKHQFNNDERYEIGAIIGDGRSCRIVEAVDTQNNDQKIAIKILSKKKEINETLYKREIEILAQVEHANIVQFIDAKEDHDNCYILISFYEGGDLFDRIVNKEYNITEKVAVTFITDFLRTIQYLHAMDIVHRDLKPENIIFENNKSFANMRLIDFGSAQVVDDEKKYKNFRGSVHYLSAELAELAVKKKGNVTGKILKDSDIWSIGIIAYFMLTRKHPFEGKTDKDIFINIINGELRFPSHPSLSDGFKDFVGKMLIKDPEQRITIKEALLHSWIQANNTITYSNE